MKKSDDNKPWPVISEIERVKTHWMELIGENLLDNDGQELEYWRVEKPDGLLVITLRNGKLILPKQMYRPGVGKYTLDLCGGRINKAESLEDQAIKIVNRELDLKTKNPFESLKILNPEGWEADSSFTNVKIFVVVGEIKSDIKINNEAIGATYSLNDKGIADLLSKLSCLQCRLAIREFTTN